MRYDETMSRGSDDAKLLFAFDLFLVAAMVGTAAIPGFVMPALGLLLLIRTGISLARPERIASVRLRARVAERARRARWQRRWARRDQLRG